MIEFVDFDEQVILLVDLVEVHNRQVCREVTQPVLKEVFNTRIIFLSSRGPSNTVSSQVFLLHRRTFHETLM